MRGLGSLNFASNTFFAVARSSDGVSGLLALGHQPGAEAGAALQLDPLEERPAKCLQPLDERLRLGPAGQDLAGLMADAATLEAEFLRIAGGIDDGGGAAPGGEAGQSAALAREKLDVVTIILNNGSYAILNIELMRVGVQNPGPKALSMLDLKHPEINWTRIAEGMGVPAVRAATAEEFRDALEQALKAKGPRLIEALL